MSRLYKILYDYFFGKGTWDLAKWNKDKAFGIWQLAQKGYWYKSV